MLVKSSLSPFAALSLGISPALRVWFFLLGAWWTAASSLGATVTWEAVQGGRMAMLPAPGASAQSGFALVSRESSGVLFTNMLTRERALENQIELNGSGVALGDVDGDGWSDIFLSGLDVPNRLFRNLGQWRFEEVTASAGVACPQLRCTGAVFADVDGDGDLDLVINTLGQGTHLFFNDGHGHFTPAPGAPLNPGRAGMSLALADVDDDGDLDLYIANYRTETIRDRPETRFQGERIKGRLTVMQVDGRPVSDPDLAGRFDITESGKIIENGEPDVLLINNGHGVFTPVSFTGGAFLDAQGQPLAKPPYDWGLSVVFRDLNGDGRPDLYVCNDFESPDRLWFNRGHGQFQAAGPEVLRHTSIFSMGVDVGDLNRDGADDLIVSDMLMQDRRSRQLRIGDVPVVPHLVGSSREQPQYSFNTVQCNRGDGTFAEISWFLGAEASGWTWCPVLLDVDLDGWEDVLFTTGHEFDMMNADVIQHAEMLKAQKQLTAQEQRKLRSMFKRFNTPTVAFRNLQGQRFEDHSQAWGFTNAAVSQGIALADLDNDGDLDVVINNLNEPSVIYQNLSTAPRVEVRLRGLPPNTMGIGARITLLGGAVPSQSQEMMSGGRYLSCDSPARVFAAGSTTNVMRLEVRWRSGKRSRLDGVLANRIYEIDETQAGPPSIETNKPAATWFAQVEGFHPHHIEPWFDDAERQPLLPFRLSQLGPGVAWVDYDGDGWEDLAIGCGRGGFPAIFHNNHQGGLDPVPDLVRSKPASRDLAGVVGSRGLFIMGASNYEDGTTNGGWIRLFDTQRGMAGDSLLGPTSSSGPVALADVDGDGDLDLFVGGRARAGQYPEPADSMLCRNDAGKLVPVHRWERLGLVSGAVFSDLNGDGRPDLILACDWGALRVFRNEGAFQFREITRECGLEEWTGWWHGVTVGDFDGDGRMDLAASNWGLNSAYRASADRPFKCYYGDFDGDGVTDFVEAQRDDATGQDVPWRGFRALGSSMPWLREQVGTFEKYSKCTMKDLFGERLVGAQVLQVRTFASMVFLNRGDKFEPHELPPEAQWTAAFGMTVGDFDGDGREDLFLSQNYFAVAPDGVRQDAGRGLWLRGDGKGGFQSVPGQESGVVVLGEQRGCALADFDGDGRVDLAVTQNGETAKLFRNQRAKPGLRIRLEGPPGNQAAFGASIRLKVDGHFGPRREIHAGSGYWSQDGAIQVMAAEASRREIEVRWPDGKTTATTVPPAAREITLTPDGQVKATKPIPSTQP